MWRRLILLSVIAQCVIGCQKKFNKGFFKKPIKILSLNMWGVNPFRGFQDSRMGFLTPHKQERIEATRKAVKKARYDVVFLQEVWFREDHEELANGLKFSTPYGLGTDCDAHDSPSRIVFPTNCHGLVTLSSVEMKNTIFIPFKETGLLFEEHGSDVHIVKGFLVSKIELENGVDVLFINTNLAMFHPQNDVNLNTRILQVKEILAFLDEQKSTTAVIIGGSLNSDDEEDSGTNTVMKLFQTHGFVDSFESLYNSTTCSKKDVCSTWGTKVNTFTPQSVRGTSIEMIRPSSSSSTSSKTTHNTRISPGITVASQFRLDNILIWSKCNESTSTTVLYELPNYTAKLLNETQISVSDHSAVHVEIKVSSANSTNDTKEEK